VQKEDKMIITRMLTYITVAALVMLPLHSGDAANPDNPAQFDAKADVEIVELITIDEIDNLDFGRVAKPSVGSTRFIVDTGGGITVLDSDGQALNGHHQGIYDIFGTDGAGYQLMVTAGLCDHTGLTLKDMTHDAGPTLDNLGVNVGGTLTVDTSTTDGPHKCDYTLTAQYT
jgi:hypothetical protein